MFLLHTFFYVSGSHIEKHVATFCQHFSYFYLLVCILKQMALPLLAPPYTLAGCRTAKERVEALMDLWFGDEFSSLITQFSPLKTQLIECMDVHCTLQNYALVLETALKTPHVTFSASYQTRWEGLKEWILRESNRVEAVVIELRKAMQSVFEQTERSLSTLATYESVNLTSEFNTFASHGFWNLGYLTV